MNILKISMTEEEAASIIAFIKSHERKEIPDEVWDICMRLMDLADMY